MAIAEDMVLTHADIPKAEYYVCCNDSFMSGWGHSQGKINTLIFPCSDYNEAKKVAEYAESRGDQKYVRINRCKPQLKLHSHLYQCKSKETYPAWYK